MSANQETAIIDTIRESFVLTRIHGRTDKAKQNIRVRWQNCWEYIQFTKSETNSQFNLNLGTNNYYKAVDNAFSIIQKQVKRICQLDPPGGYDFPNLVKSTQKHESFKESWDFSLPNEVKKYVWKRAMTNTMSISVICFDF